MKRRLAGFPLVATLAALAASAGQTPQPQNLTLAANPAALQAQGLSRAEFYQRLGSLRGEQMVDVAGKRMTKAELIRDLDALRIQLSTPLVASHGKGLARGSQALRVREAALETKRRDFLASENAKAAAGLARFK